MQNRRRFIQVLSALGAGALVSRVNEGFSAISPSQVSHAGPVILSTWAHGIEANEAAMFKIRQGGTVLDAVETGVMVTESDPHNMSVGIGGLPDRDGHVTLDACIMGPDGEAGSVCFLEGIEHPVSVARMVMEKTPHVMLAGEGAQQFAVENGFEVIDLLTPESEKAWKKWVRKAKYEPKANWEKDPNLYHDTIGLIALDEDGNLAGACTTSGMPFKVRGRVGDSPIIGAGLYVDNEVGAATATGMGEFMMKTLGAFLVVELMRQGHTPQDACEMAIKRIVDRYPDKIGTGESMMQVGYIALNKSGEIGAYSLVPGFEYALYRDGENILIDSNSFYKETEK